MKIIRNEVLRTLLVFLLVYATLHAQDFAFNRIRTAQFTDYTAISVPANPPVGTVRWFQNSATNILQCLRSDGSNCTPVVPVAGAIVLSSTVCPVGFIEYTAIDGRTPMGTLAAHGNVGTMGGNDSITPTGSLAMDAMDPHAHQLPLMIDQDNLVTQYPKVGVFGEGPDTGSGIMQQNNDGVSFATKPFDLSEAVSAGTPTGTFNGDAGDNRSAFIRIIYCVKT